MTNSSNDQSNPIIQDDQADMPFDADVASAEPLREKLADALLPGFQVEFDAEEAERAGAFQEDALSEGDALDSALDLSSDEGQ